MTVAKEKTFLDPSSMMALIVEKDARGLADAGLLGVTPADDVTLVLAGHAVGGGRPGVDGVELDVVLLHHDMGDESADMPEAVESDAGGHGHGGGGGGGLEGGAGE